MKKEKPLTTWRRINLELLWKPIYKAIASWLIDYDHKMESLLSDQNTLVRVNYNTSIPL